jgi:hypothetical protein
LLDKSEYILPVRFDDTEIPGLPPTVGYLAFADHGVRGICEALLEKLQISPCGATTQTATSQATTTRTVTPEPSEYLEQRRRLPDTEILPKIYAKLRWRIGIYSTEFRKARFRDLDHCLQFMRSASVRVEGWFPRVLAHHRALDEIPQLGGRVHVLEILDTTTAAFEFTSRMTEQRLLLPEAVITFEMHGVDGRLLTWPADVFRDTDAVGCEAWCQESEFRIARQATPTDFQTRKRELALETALEIYGHFGWLNPPVDRLADAQSKRFSSG